MDPASSSPLLPTIAAVVILLLIVVLFVYIVDRIAPRPPRPDADPRGRSAAPEEEDRHGRGEE